MVDPYERDEGAIVMLAGPIKHWWGENWDTPEHWHYAAWRDALNNGLVNAGYLVYRPHEAFKGKWTERAQAVNDLVLRMSDVIFDMTPDGVPSLGTDGEKQYAQAQGNALILPAPPPEDFTIGVDKLVCQLDKLDVKKAVVDQEIVIESFGVTPRRRWMFSAALQNFMGQVMRLHVEEPSEGLSVVDASHVFLPTGEDLMRVTTTERSKRIIAFPALQKLEVLARTA